MALQQAHTLPLSRTRCSIAAIASVFFLLGPDANVRIKRSGGERCAGRRPGDRSDGLSMTGWDRGGMGEAYRRLVSVFTGVRWDSRMVVVQPNGFVR